jgi:hypothetical protein
MTIEEMLAQYTPKRLWKREGDNFIVEVSQHFRNVSATQAAFAEHGLRSDDGGWRWCVYAYIFPKHRLFAEFNDSDSFSQDVCQDLHFHHGPSYLRRHRNEKGEVTCYQVGSDYNHLYDERFTRAETAADACQVFEDAQALFSGLVPPEINIQSDVK